MRVFVVFADLGSFHEYGEPRAVFSSRKLADEYIGRVEISSLIIEELELDAPSEEDAA